MTAIRRLVAQRVRQLQQVERLGDNVVRAYIADFERRAVKAVRSGGRVKLTQAERQKIIDELADLMLLGFVRRYRQEKRELGIELNLSFSREVAKLSKGLDLDIGGIRESFAKLAKKRSNESIDFIEDKINSALKVVTSRQQPTRTAVSEMRRRLSEMGLSARKPAVVETLVRTHAQMAFSAAQWKLNEDDEDDVIWGFRFSAVGDDRTRPEHLALDGFTAPKNDPIWDRYTPPLDYNCRCQLIELTEPAERSKLPAGAALAIGEGFDFNPGKVLAA